ncbi:MAG TPA: hypothetical protein VF177_16790, partial [Anaerolineae bacterium]
SASYLSNLHRLLNQYFNLEEIRTLCFQMNVDYESVRGEEKPSRIRELLIALGRNGRLPELVELVRRERPRVSWPPVPDDFQLPAALESGSSAALASQYHYYGDVVHGDKVGGDKIGGDKISVGDISGSSGVAIGRGASASVQIQQGLGGDELSQLFAPLLAEAARQDPKAVAKVQTLKAEVARGDDADDEKMADLIGDIADAAPAVVESLVNLFTNSVVARVAGGATKYVLKRIRMSS